MTAEIKQKIKSLNKQIKYHNKLYYKKTKPIISDFEYDILVQELNDIYKKYPEYKPKNNSINLVGNDLKVGGIPHIVPMYSIDNRYNLSSLKEFFIKIITEKNSTSVFPEVTMEHKIDGVSANILYDSGSLVYATTRGNGLIGEEITSNLKTIKSIPLKIPFQKKVEVRGEIFIPKDKFKTLDKKFANPRNTAAGTIKLKNSKKAKERGLNATFYSIGFCQDKSFKTQSEILRFLSKNGFSTSLHNKKVKSFVEIEEYCSYWQKNRKNLNYEIDGIVIKINNLKLQNTLGFTSKFPRWAIAYKFIPDIATTKVLDIHYQVGRTGAITPVAKFSPVNLAGSIIQRATLFNKDEMKRLGLNIGDKVEIIKSGEIIPKVLRVISKGKSKSVFPVYCPECGNKLEKIQAIHYCENSNCPAQIKRKLEHFVSKQAMDIDGLGKAQIELFYNIGLLKSISDIYKLDYKKIANLKGQAEKSVNNLKNSINRSLLVPFERVLFGLGIRFVGFQTSNILVEYFGNIEKLKNASKEDLMGVNDVGKKVAESIFNYFRNENNLKLIDYLKECGLNFNIKRSSTDDFRLKNLNFLATGTLFEFSRIRFKQIVRENGGNNLSGVSKKLDFLVVGQKPGSKVIKAQKIPSIKIISEEEFLNMIKKEN